MKLTKQQLEKHFKNNTQCPYCGSTCIMDTQWDLNKGLPLATKPVYVSMYCDSCEKGWTEEYEMVAVDGQRVTKEQLPVVCAWCKKQVGGAEIVDNKISHTICDDCMSKHFPKVEAPDGSKEP